MSWDDGDQSVADCNNEAWERSEMYFHTAEEVKKLGVKFDSYVATPRGYILADDHERLLKTSTWLLGDGK